MDATVPEIVLDYHFNNRAQFLAQSSQPSNDLKERVSECLPGVECVPREAPVGDSRANGSAENAVKQVKGEFRTLKTSTEDRYSCKIDAKSCLLVWIPRHCANLMTRFFTGIRTVGRPFSGSQDDVGADQWWCLEKESW